MTTKFSDTTKTVSGDLKAFNIFDVTQSLMMGRKTAHVTVQSGNRRGYLDFSNGQIVGALDDTLGSGDRAAMNVFAWVGGTFTIEFDRPPNEVNIKMPTDHLLLEVARNIDEIRREQELEPEPTEALDSQAVASSLSDRIDDQLRQKVNSIFKRVATAAEPVRSRYSKGAFDHLLQALNDLKGTALFLRPDQRPRVRTAHGFTTIKDAVITQQELEGFLAILFNESEAREFRETKETSCYFHTEVAGSFRVHAVSEHGAILLSFSPAARELPTLDQAAQTPETLAVLREITQGLIVIGGPLGSGKEALIGALVEDHLVRRDAFAVEFSNGSGHRYDGERGTCVRKSVPSVPGRLHDSVCSALEQEPDVIAFVGAESREAFHLALAAASGERLVILALESQSENDTLRRLLRLAKTADGDPLFDILAERLRLVLDIVPAHGARAAELRLLRVDRDLASLFTTGDIDGVRRHRLATARA